MKKWLKIGLVIVLVVIVLFTGISAYLGYTMTRVKRVPIEENPGQYGLKYEDVAFPSIKNKLELKGWLIPAAGSQSIIIMVHGEGYHRADPSIKMLDIADQLVSSGYNVLMFDLRGHGESEGSMVSGGYYETEDLRGAVKYVGEKGFSNIGVLGFSIGAVTALIAGAQDQDIDAIVADSSFADLKDIMGPEFSKRTKFPDFFLSPLLMMIKLLYGVDFNAIEPVKYVPQIAPRPIYFIHGELDETIPVEHANRLLQAANNPQNQIWIVPQAPHVRAYALYPDEYITRVTAFFDTALK